MVKLQQNVPLKDFSNYKIGGNTAYFLEVFSKEELQKALKEWKKISSVLPRDEQKIFILGDGTNILFSDEGFNGLVIKNSIKGISVQNNAVTAGAGEKILSLLNFCSKNSLSGLEWAGGLPGTVGGAIRGNAGAFGGEIKDSLKEVTSLNLKTLETIKRSNNDCEFSYRNSLFKKTAIDEIILSAVFFLENGDKTEIQNKINEKIEYRKAKHPLEYPNIGSIFKNVPVEQIPDEFKDGLFQYVKNDPFPVVPTAKIIFLTGLKGKKVGNVMVSTKHTNYIVNLGNGKAAEVKELINIVKNKVHDKFGIELEEEIMYV